MRLVLDASVVIAATRPSEPSYGAARARLERALRGADTLVLPSVFVVEVSGALARQGRSRADIRRLIEVLTRPPHEVMPIGLIRARAASAIAIANRLRGPDALYVWLANREQVALCTLDKEIFARAAGRCQLVAP
jgi:predicted nucleic acid-binding protein